MSSASVTNNFTNGLIGDADQVDQNFADLVSFLNTHVMHKGETGLEAKSGSPGNKFQAGQSSQTTSATSDISVTFPVAFATAPIFVLCTGRTPSSGGNIPAQFAIDTVTATGFSGRVFSTSGANIVSQPVTFWWLAVAT